MSPLRRGATRTTSRAAWISILATTCLLLALAGSAGAATHPKPHRDHGRGHWFRPTCNAPARGAASCNAEIVTNASGTPLATTAPPAGALGPAQLAAAYALPVTAPSNVTIAIIDAYDDPNIESDLAIYNAYYGLPACTTANGCFRKVDQNGGTTYPAKSTGWAEEISLDVEVAHAICQRCKILLVEAASATFDNLGLAVNRAITMGATVVSNSWGGNEFSGQTSLDRQYFTHPGVVITASSGDSGYGAQYPAASAGVVAVGGTTLNLNADGSYRSESAWSGAGSGCSAFETRPTWQSVAGCTRRAISDVSAVADPNTGAAVYDSYGTSGWLQVGGTSLAAPLIAAVYALAGNTSNPSAPYANTAALHDVTTGSNGSCNAAILCNARVGYDGPTGLGTPNGLAAFGGAPAPPASPDYSLSVSPASQSATQGQSASYTVTLTPNATFGNASVGVSATSSPADVSLSGCSAALTTASPSCTLTVGTATAATASHTLTVNGTGSAGLPAHAATATLQISAPVAPDYTLGVSPSSQSLTQGQGASYTVTMTPNATFGSSNSVVISAASDPADVTFDGCTAALTATAPTCTLTVATTGAATTSHALTVNGAGSAGLPARSATATLQVTAPLAPDYALAVSPASQSVTQGQSASYTVTMTPNATFGDGSVAVTASSAPADAAFTGCSAPLTVLAPTCTLVVATTGSAIASHSLTVTGTGSAGLPTRSAGATLVVQAVSIGDFSLAISPASGLVFTPATLSWTVTLTRISGFSGDVALAVSGLPATWTSTLSPFSAANSATLTITAPKTSYRVVRVTVTGTNGALVHTTTSSLTVF